MIIKSESKSLKILYEITMAFFAIVVAVILIIEFTENPTEQIKKLCYWIDTGILIIFVIDYFTRLFLSKDKLVFIRSNIIELIAIIPFNSVFQVARITRLTRLFRLLKIMRLFSFTVIFYKKVDSFIKTNNFHYVIWITFSTLILGSIGISFEEHMSFGNALWWAFVTTTTVGYGDISPVTPGGRIIAVILMIVGIGFIGMLTGTIATYFIKRKEENKKFKNEIIENIKAKLDNFKYLDKEEINDICKVLQSLSGDDKNEINNRPL